MDVPTLERWQKLLQEEINWDYLLQIARRHKLMPLLYWHLHQTNPAIVPPSIWQQLQQYFDESCERNQFLTVELLNLLSLFERHSILAIPYKGSALSIEAYGDLSLRLFRDIDLLVHPQDLKKSKKLLIDNGYILVSELFWENDFRSQDGRIVIDLHREITPKFFSFSFEFDDFRQRLKTILINNTPVLSFSTEDLILILCVYLARDCWQKKEKLVQVCDIAELIRTYPSINWGWLVQKSAELGSQRMLFLGLFLAKELCDIHLPDKVLEQIKADPMITSLAMQVCQWFFKEDAPDLGLERKLFYLKVRERLQDIIVHIPYLVEYSVTPSKTDQDFLFLPDSISFLYYLVRPIRLITQSVMRLFDRFFNNIFQN
ncbi:MAG: nucleotidyltransferase family protein [Crocosphaera sp.]